MTGFEIKAARIPPYIFKKKLKRDDDIARVVNFMRIIQISIQKLSNPIKQPYPCLQRVQV